MVFTGIVEQRHIVRHRYKIQIDIFSIFSPKYFNDNLVMGQIQLPPPNHENIKIENAVKKHG